VVDLVADDGAEFRIGLFLGVAMADTAEEEVGASDWGFETGVWGAFDRMRIARDGWQSRFRNGSWNTDSSNILKFRPCEKAECVWEE
jgi:hypothetical protein